MKSTDPNIRKPCSISGCYALRTGFSNYCTMHSSRQRENGHALQLAVEKRTLKPYLKMARRFLKVHAAHPATLAAVDAMRECLYAPDSPPIRHKKLNNGPYNTWVELKRLEKSNVRPDEALAVVIAVALLRMYEPRQFKSDKTVAYTTAQQVFRLRELGGYETWDHDKQRSVKETKAPGSQARAYFGLKVRRKLGVYLLGVEQLIQREATALEQRARDLASLAVTPTTEAQAAAYDALAATAR
jgi:hypothetical protein